MRLRGSMVAVLVSTFALAGAAGVINGCASGTICGGAGSEAPCTGGGVPSPGGSGGGDTDAGGGLAGDGSDAGLDGGGGEGPRAGGTGGASGRATGGGAGVGGTGGRGGSASGGVGGASGASGGVGGASGGASGGVGGASGGASGGVGGASGGAGGGAGAMGASRARAFATKLGRRPNFLIGTGADLQPDHDQDGAYTLGVTLDLHYAYLVGLPGLGGWPDWNPGGKFIDVLFESADRHGVTPMYTVYSFAAMGENRTDVLANTEFMGKWWAAARLLFDRLGVFGKPAVVHVEPDFWAYMQQKSGGDPSKVKVLVKMVADCADLPDDLAGLGNCFVRLGRKYAPKAVIGFHASEWGGSPADVAAFLNAVGAKETDFVVMDVLDRDAGCFEAKVDPVCQRGGTFYWDETNTTSPNFKEYLAMAKTISDGTGKAILWWQVPFGVPSATPGGTSGHYRDNRVHYLFNHVQEFIAAGFAGATFGAGAEHQTSLTTDGGQFKSAVGAYFAAPVPLP